MTITQKASKILRRIVGRQEPAPFEAPPLPDEGLGHEPPNVIYPNREAIESSAEDQIQSLFFTKTPIEIRNMIYRELWRNSGLSQHIFRRQRVYGNMKSRFTHSPCVTQFNVEDQRQKELQKLSIEFDLPPSDGGIRNSQWGRRCHSSWYNHWCCLENHINETTGGRAKQHRVEPFLPMLLTCKKM
jgi:hypothetical protein